MPFVFAAGLWYTEYQQTLLLFNVTPFVSNARALWTNGMGDSDCQVRLGVFSTCHGSFCLWPPSSGFAARLGLYE